MMISATSMRIWSATRIARLDVAFVISRKLVAHSEQRIASTLFLLFAIRYQLYALSQQFDAELNHFDRRDGPDQIDGLVQHLVHVHALVRHTRDPEDRLLPELEITDLRDRHIKLVAQTVFEAQEDLSLRLQGMAVRDV